MEKESPLVQDSWIPLVSFDVKEGFCVALDKYMGEFGYSMQRAVGLPARICPVPKVRFFLQPLFEFVIVFNFRATIGPITLL